jgi:hypothetical protein
VELGGFVTFGVWERNGEDVSSRSGCYLGVPRDP